MPAIDSDFSAAGVDSFADRQSRADSYYENATPHARRIEQPWYNGVLRLHLALIVPEPREALTLRVGDRICHWEEGKVLIFDDYFEHEVWNGSTGTRVVLFCDFIKPLRFPANIVNWPLLNLAPFMPFVREAQECHKAWEKQFYRDPGAST